MSDSDIDQAITDGLLAYFRHGESFQHRELGALKFADSHRLLRLHWAFSTEMQLLFQHLISRHGEIISRSTVRLDETMGGIRGHAIWPYTHVRRQITGNSHLVIYRDLQKTYETGPNKVLMFVIVNALRLLEPYAGRTGLANTPYGQAIRHTFALAIRCRRVMELKQVASQFARNSMRRPSMWDVKQASSSKRRVYPLAAQLYQMYQDTALSEVKSLSNLLRSTVIAPLFAWQRFELFAVLHLGLALEASIGHEARLHDLTGAMEGPAVTVGPFAIYWGVRPPGARRPSALPRKRQHLELILSRFGLSPRTGRSDITITCSTRPTVLAVAECKYSSDKLGDSAQQFREAANQLLDYVEDYEGDSDQRLTKSAIVMRWLPSEVSSRGGVVGPSDPIALSANDLLFGSMSLQKWLQRLEGSNAQNYSPRGDA